MPMKSKAQRRFLHAKKPTVAGRFEAHTRKGDDLPERIGAPGGGDQSKMAVARLRKRGGR